MKYSYRLLILIALLQLFFLIFPGVTQATEKTAYLGVSAFANVYMDTQPIEINISPSTQVKSIELAAMNGKIIIRKILDAGTKIWHLSPLEAGYYYVIWQDQRLPLAILISRPEEQPSSDVVAVDCNLTWQGVPQEWGKIAKLLKQCGVQWVRERVSWRRIEPQKNNYHWKGYDEPIEVLVKENMKVIQTFHDAPKWSRADRLPRHTPDNLLEAYEFARDYAKRFKGKVIAFEGWNEPNLHFLEELPDHLAAMQKAWFIGLKDGNANIKVLSPAFTRLLPQFELDYRFLDQFLSCDGGKYFDIFNFHEYGAVHKYPQLFHAINQQLQKSDLAGIPIWATEMGVPIALEDEVRMTEREMNLQAQFISQMYPQALALGVKRIFWFVMTACTTPDKKWHSLLAVLPEDTKFGYGQRKQGHALPSLCTLSTTAYALRDGQYMGTIKTGLPSNIKACLFDRGDQTACLAIWQSSSEADSKVVLPINMTQVSEGRDYLGGKLNIPVTGSFKLNVSANAQYWVISLQAAKNLLKYQVPPLSHQPPAIDPKTCSRIISRMVFPTDQINQADWYYALNAKKTNKAHLEVYNLSEQKFSGTVSIQIPKHWHLSKDHFKIHVLAMSRLVLPVTLHTLKSQSKVYPLELVVRDHHNKIVDRNYLRVSNDPKQLPADKVLSLDMNNPSIWKNNIAGKGIMSIESGTQGGVSFDVRFDESKKGSPWCFPMIVFNPTADLRKYNAIRFEYRLVQGKNKPFYLQVAEDDKTSYISPRGMIIAKPQWQEITLLLNQLIPTTVWPDMENDHLDLNRIMALRIGGVLHEDIKFEVRNMKIIKLKD